MSTPQKLILAHANCADGFMASYVAYLALKVGSAVVDVQYVSYGDVIPDLTGKEVYILDFSYNPETLIEAAKSAHSVLLLDHHRTALDQWLSHDGDSAELDACDFFETNMHENLRVRIDMSQSGAGLAWARWKHAVNGNGDYGDTDRFVRALQRAVLAVEDRDLWKKVLPKTEEICAALSNVPREFKAFSNYLYWTPESEIVAAGAAILQRNRVVCESIAKNAFDAVFMGQDPAVPVVNCNKDFASDVGHLLDEGVPFSITYAINSDIAYVSLRSRPQGADVAGIAQHFGGGGHKHAAGFSLRVDEFFAMLTF